MKNPNEKSLIKWQNQMIKKHQPNRPCHIPDLVQAFSNVKMVD